MFDYFGPVGYNNPALPWRQLEAALSGRLGSFPGDGGDSPAWSNKRPSYRPSAGMGLGVSKGKVPYAELHCHSNFSFLDGASHPEELVEEAACLGLEALALTDHDGLYGVVRFAQAAREVGLPAVVGAEMTLGLDGPQEGRADPQGHHLVVLARDQVGYSRLCRAISASRMWGGRKGLPRMDLLSLAAIGSGASVDLERPLTPGELAPAGETGHWLVLTGCRKGSVPAALVNSGPGAARRELARICELFGRQNVAVEVWDHGDPLDSARNDALAELAAGGGVELVATNNVHYHRPGRRRLANALASVRARRSLDEMDGWLAPASGAHLRSGEEQKLRFARYPGVVERAAELAKACQFDLALVAPKLPPFSVPEGHNEQSWLAHLVELGATRRYGPRADERHARAWRQLDHELELIGQLGFAGYFLVVWDLVEFCRRQGIYCQGRGSAANSAVCYALGITNVDAVALGLLFERFLSPERDGPPDIDVDIESGRREEVIRYVYERYGRGRAAQVANVITYRPRLAVRDMGRALGASPGQLDAWSKKLDGWSCLEDAAGIPGPVLDLAAQVQRFPRHLGIHSGGMVICDRPVSQVCPVEWARMPGRSVLQWDKDDCAAAGLVKFDLLGLGMLSALHSALDHVAAFWGLEVDLARIPQEEAVYDMLCRADSVGVFQVESRAQMATLPRLKPRRFYDLVVEVALIRPGPIQGGSVHPYIRRRNGQEEVTYLHPLLEHSLAKTLGVPLFQEQLMQIAIDVADFTPSEADQLRQAMGSKRSAQRMERLRARLYEGMSKNGIVGEVADAIWTKLVAFANYGFPESHSVSFAYLVYASAWLKYHYPSAFCAALLDCQPMGFWSPQTLVADARRHGVVVLGPDVNASGARSTLEPCPSSAGGAALRLGLCHVRGLGAQKAQGLAAARPYADIEDVVRRAGLSVSEAEALASAGAFGCFGSSRRAALWAAGALGGQWEGRQGRLGGMGGGMEAPPLPEMTPLEEHQADLWATGLSPESFPTQYCRPFLAQQGVLTAAELVGTTAGSRVKVAGVVTHRQRPATAGGVTFLNIEDETGLVNVVCSPGCWRRWRKELRSPAVVVQGRLEKVETVINLVAERVETLKLAGESYLSHRDFR